MFDATLGHDPSFEATHWQVIGPVRDAAHGTRKLNAIIQDHFHSWAKFPKRAPGGAILRWPIRFGQEQITGRDKVMQVVNERLWAYDADAKADVEDRVPVFNGQIGRVCGEWPFAQHRYRKGQRGSVKRIRVQFDGLPNLRFDYNRTGGRGVDRQLELAYAITVHKSQGSQFKHVFFVVPAEAASFFRA
jgi:ATP-dependent exoDNAse (exonuclease V) alpha subunit